MEKSYIKVMLRAMDRAEFSTSNGMSLFARAEQRLLFEEASDKGDWPPLSPAHIGRAWDCFQIARHSGRAPRWTSARKEDDRTGKESSLGSFPAHVGWPCLLEILKDGREVDCARAKENFLARGRLLGQMKTVAN